MRPRPSNRRLAAWLVGVGLSETLIFLVYGIAASLSCFLGGSASGGMADSVGAAAVIGLVLLVGTGGPGWKLRRRLRLLWLGAVSVYIAALVVLAQISPAIWGPARCSGGGFF
jgi:hypothetical protein